MPNPKAPLSVFPFHAGDTLFAFEPGQVRIFGQLGTEAAVPLSDLAALLDHLGAEAASPPNPRSQGLLPEDTD